MAGRSPRLDAVRPNPLLGTCYYVPSDHTGERTEPNRNMLAAYRFPPSVRSAPGNSAIRRYPVPAFFPDSVIGPVVGVDHTATTTAALINNLWVTVWSCMAPGPFTAPTPIPGALHLRPIPAGRFAPTWTDGPWDHPFQDLWLYTPDLGISHLAAPGRHAPPRFLLTGAAWFRLSQVHAFIRRHPSGDLLRGGLSMPDRLALARTLHLHLDYPPIPNGPYRSPGLALFQQCDLVPRQRIHTFLQDWIHRRRVARAELRRRLIHDGRLLPPSTLPLGNVIQSIAECL